MRKLGVVMALRRDDKASVWELYEVDGRPAWTPINPDYIEANTFVLWMGPQQPPLEEQLARNELQQERYEEVIKEAMASPSGVGIRSYDPCPRSREEARPLRPCGGTPERPTADRQRDLNADSKGLTY